MWENRASAVALPSERKKALAPNGCGAVPRAWVSHILRYRRG